MFCTGCCADDHVDFAEEVEVTAFKVRSAPGYVLTPGQSVQYEQDLGSHIELPSADELGTLSMNSMGVFSGTPSIYSLQGNPGRTGPLNGHLTRPPAVPSPVQFPTSEGAFEHAKP